MSEINSLIELNHGQGSLLQSIELRRQNVAILIVHCSPAILKNQHET